MPRRSASARIDDLIAISSEPASGRPSHRPPSRGRLALFAGGDFAFNLYWQSVTLFQLFYYTEALRIPLAVAAASHAFASVWDGIVSFAAGLLTDRLAGERMLARALAWGAVPLGLAFVMAYLPPPAGVPALPWLLAGQLLFRTAYALVNLPYLAMSARISLDSSDRALVAGGRMLAGTLAAVLVAVTTVPLGRLMTGASGPGTYAAAAALFAGLGSILLIVVGSTYRDGPLPPSAPRAHLTKAVLAALRNRAFVTLAAAMAAMIMAVTVLDRSVLYYFKYALNDERGGQLTIGMMMLVSGLAVPAWLAVSRKTGIRGVWFLAIGLSVVALGLFIAAGFRTTREVQIFLIIMQSATVGLHFAIWALLPDTVEWGQHATAVRNEAVLYGLAALIQRLAIAGGTLLLGLGLLREESLQADGGGSAFRLTLAILPLSCFAISGLFMIANPLRRGSHARVVTELNGPA